MISSKGCSKPAAGEAVRQALLDTDKAFAAYSVGNVLDWMPQDRQVAESSKLG